MISYYAMHELVELLQDTTFTFTDIADRMNFSTQPFFSSYVKKMLGVSPSEYRRDMDNWYLVVCLTLFIYSLRII